MERDELLTTLEQTRDSIMDLEVVLDPMRKERDQLIVEGLRMGITERPLCRASGITRGWLYNLKKEANLPRRRYIKSKVKKR